jgi:hypothetical protein
MQNKLIFIITTIILACLLLSCNEKQNDVDDDVNNVNWNKREVLTYSADSLITGKTYLSVYSHIYSQSEHKNQNLTATVSMRNINIDDTVFIEKAVYYDTKGEKVRTYIDKPVYIKPLETIEIVILQKDKVGGSGANFIFEWKTKSNIIEPHFESVMISTMGQQGLSFTTQGIRIE